MKIKLSLVATTVLLAGLALAAVDGVKLVWKPEKGLTKYKMTGKAIVDLGGQTAEAEISADIERTIKEVEDGKVTVEEVQKNYQLTIMGQSMGDMPPVSSTTVYSLDGKIVSRKSDASSEMESPRMELAMNLVYPDKDKELKKGDTWTAKFEADSSKGTYDLEQTYTFEGEDEVKGIKTYKITINIKESGAPTDMTGTIKYWLRQDNGEVVRQTLDIKKAPVSDQIPPVDMTGTLELAD
jgi:hypothetical protein